MSRRSAMLAVAAVLSAFASRPAAAQVEVTPFVGMALTTRNLIFDTAGGGFIRMNPHTVFGVRVGTPVSRTFRVELALTGGSGTLEYYPGEDFEHHVSMLAADLRGRFRVAGGEGGSLALVGGVGYTKYDVGLFEATEEIGVGSFDGKVSGLVGVGFDARLSERFRLSVDLHDRIHAQGFDFPGTDNDIEQTQHNLTFAAGLTFPLGK